MENIRSLAADPFPSEVVRVKGKTKEKIFRVRVGDYRILVDLTFNPNIIWVRYIDHRGRVYKRI